MAASDVKIGCGRSKRLKRLKWSRQETINLISAWKDMSQLFKTFGQRKPFYEEISKKLICLGHNRSTEQCQTKMNRLKYLYRRSKSESDKSLLLDENIEEMLNECYMSDDEAIDDCIEGNNSILCPALYVQAELELSPEREEQDDKWDICEHSLDVNEESCCNIEVYIPPTSSACSEDSINCVIQKSKTKSEIWTHKETLTLISEWKKIYESDFFRDMKKSNLKKGMYEDLANTLASYGYIRTAEQCQKKMSNLKVKYKKQDRPNGNTNWPYYSALHEFLGKHINKCSTCTRSRINVEDSWTNNETESLISVWKQLNTELEKTVIRTPIYEKMSHHLTEVGFKRNAEECQQKVIQLKILYRQATSCNASYFDELWPYYDAVHEIMSQSIDKTDFVSKYTPFLLKKTLLLEYANEYNTEKRMSLKECPSNGSEWPLTNNIIENKFAYNLHDYSLVNDGDNNDNGVINTGRKSIMEPRKILPKSSTNIVPTVRLEQDKTPHDSFTKLNVETINQTIPCLEPLLLIVSPSSTLSSVSDISKSSNLVLVPQDASNSLSTNLTSNIQQISNSWPTSLLLIPMTESSASSLQNQDGIMSVKVENHA